MRLLVTGFTTFGEHEVNPSQLVVEALAGCYADVEAVALPVAYDDAGAQIARLIEERQPDAVVMLGLAARRTAINLERFALNIDDADVPDNAGDHRSGQPIVPDGPHAYLSTLPLDAMLAALNDRAIPAAISNHAGVYVCNHVFYSARHALEHTSRPVQCGFIHLPSIAETEDQPGLPLAALVEGVECCLEVLRSEAAPATVYEHITNPGES